MTLRARILGCGTSSGVPRIGNDWGACDPANPRNRRTRASILVETDTTRILVDTSPDMRAQLLAADVDAVDAILWTHDHADHCHGIDDVRQLYHGRRQRILAFARREPLDLLRRRFAYAFEGRDGYPSIIDAAVLPDQLTIGDIAIHSVDQPHGAIYSTGFRFSHHGKTIAYSTDFHEVTDVMADMFANVDLWIVDALRAAPHPTHAHLALTLDAIAALQPGRAYLTHMDQSMDYDSLCAMLPDTVRPAHDGLIIEP